MLVLVTLVVLDKVPTNDYALTPGNATPVAPLVKIDGVASETHHGKIMFTDVDLQSLNAFQWIFMHFQSHVQFISSDQPWNPVFPLMNSRRRAIWR